jgi:Family of unknown function (DUF6152)
MTAGGSEDLAPTPAIRASIVSGNIRMWRNKMRTFALVAAFALVTGSALAHHGWGSYDAAKPVTVTGSILTSKFENPHAVITVRGGDKTWTVTLAPTSRMNTRGATQQVVAVGKDVSAYGYPSTVEKDEMRAERITVDGKTYEMR